MVDYASFSDMLPLLKSADVKHKPAFAALYQMLTLWQCSSPDLIFTLGGMQAAMPEGLPLRDCSIASWEVHRGSSSTSITRTMRTASIW